MGHRTPGDGSSELLSPPSGWKAAAVAGVALCSQESEFAHLIQKGLPPYTTVLASVRIYTIGNLMDRRDIFYNFHR